MSKSLSRRSVLILILISAIYSLPYLVLCISLSIDILCSRRNREIFNKVSFIEKIFTYRNGNKLWEKLSSNKYDIFYNPKDHPSITSFRIAKRVKAKVKVCISNKRHDQHYNYALKNLNAKRILEKNALL